jgi:hypothetical protein
MASDGRRATSVQEGAATAPHGTYVNLTRVVEPAPGHARHRRELAPVLEVPRVYVAAALGEVERANQLARRLRTRGARITSTWHASVAPGEVDPLDPAERRRLLLLNLGELEAASVVLVLTDGRARPRATYCEAAWALAMGLPVVWLAGAGSCLFDAHPGVTVVRTDEEAITCAFR